MKSKKFYYASQPLPFLAQSSFTKNAMLRFIIGLTFFHLTGLIVAQNQNHTEVVKKISSGDKVFFEIDATKLSEELNYLLESAADAKQLNWADILANSSNPAMDVDFQSHNITQVGSFSANTMTVSGKTIMNDSLQLNSGLRVSGSTSLESLSVNNVIQGAVSRIDNHTTNDLMEEDNLYFTETRAIEALSDTIAYLLGLIQDLQFRVASPPSVQSSYASHVLSNSAQLNGILDDSGGLTVTATGFVFGSHSDLGDGAILESSITDLFSRIVSGLNEGTTYYYSAFATNPKGTNFGDTLSFTTSPLTSTVTYDGHTYETVKIGNQWWFSENLRSTHYRNGDELSDVTDPSQWISSGGARCAYQNQVANATTYGYLYNFLAVQDLRGLCPSGWHVPTDSEWTTLASFLGGTSQAGKYLKSSPTDTPSWNGTNSSGFSALPGGVRLPYTGFFGLGSSGGWWSSTSNFSGVAWAHQVEAFSDALARNEYSSFNGMSVRCILD